LNTLGLVGIGFLLGIRHAADTDHVVAVTAIAAGHRRVLPAVLVGAWWGLGHTLTILGAGGLIVVLNLVVPPRLGLAFEFVVGMALVAVGVLNLATRGRETGAHDTAVGGRGRRAFALGLVHGLAGSAAVALLVLATVKDPWAGCAYLLVFGLGTIAGMVLITMAVAAPAALLGRRAALSGPALRVATGMLSVAFGVYTMFEAGYVDGLFGALPRWTPR
jgi:high-affinity nickel-transport protein